MAERVDIRVVDAMPRTAEALVDPGVLLVSLDEHARPNGLTIGWAFIGPSWGKSIFVAMIRPSRHSYEMVERTGDFTVNVLPPGSEMEKAVSLWGTVSGRDHDKFAESGLLAAPSRLVRSPVVEQAVISYECRVLYKTDLAPEALPEAINRSAYPKGDHHRLYFAEIVACYGNP
jgi:flavin reductase (DIM6/NTAB) family NADH-FMN oxidoreductase RutF